VTEALTDQDAVGAAHLVAVQVGMVGTAATHADFVLVDCWVDVEVASAPQVYRSPSPPKLALAACLFDACCLSFQSRQSPYHLCHLGTRQADLARRQSEE
jgi:hypothetical protein